MSRTSSVNRRAAGRRCRTGPMGSREAVGADRLAADLADAVGPVVDPPERGVDRRRASAERPREALVELAVEGRGRGVAEVVVGAAPDLAELVLDASPGSRHGGGRPPRQARPLVEEERAELWCRCGHGPSSLACTSPLGLVGAIPPAEVLSASVPGNDLEVPQASVATRTTAAFALPSSARGTRTSARGVRDARGGSGGRELKPLCYGRGSCGLRLGQTSARTARQLDSRVSSPARPVARAANRAASRFGLEGRAALIGLPRSSRAPRAAAPRRAGPRRTGARARSAPTA